MLTLAQAAEQLGLAHATLRHQVQLGRMSAQMFGKTYVVTEAEVARYRDASLGKPGRPSHRSAPRSSR